MKAQGHLGKPSACNSRATEKSSAPMPLTYDPTKRRIRRDDEKEKPDDAKLDE
jgi:hypothetical protein